MAATEKDGRSGGCAWFLAGPVLAAAGTALATALASRRWDACPFGMDAPTRASMAMSMPFAWVGITVLLVLLQALLALVLPEGIEPEVKWVVLVVAAVVLFLLLGVALGSPDAEPGGPCYQE
ncbi:hypothetical protein [Kitasatospora sp. NPDC001547]|uniref:hypothetical protein n=1 Tax=Kitasatospora sp. NPDC001547 TaxID=3364015 RepID=UPI0036BB15A0|nr:hypothetical protein KitaXyl93_56510 [Kitasatospora sp. Xyl93]